MQNAVKWFVQYYISVQHKKKRTKITVKYFNKYFIQADLCLFAQAVFYYLNFFFFFFILNLLIRTSCQLKPASHLLLFFNH